MPQIILIEKSTVIQATPIRIYRSLTDAKQLSRWMADQVESDPHEGGQIVVHYDGHEKRGEYRRLIRGVEVGIRWTQYEEAVPIDLTGFKLEKTTRGTRVRVVDFAVPEEANALLALWTARLKHLQKLYPAKLAPKKPAAKKSAVTKATKRKVITKAKTGKRKAAAKRTAK
jgi:uncharacterized protein YndB with AHSA1/START domain